MPEVIVAIGSNLGDRVAHLSAGVECLMKLSTTPVEVSPIYESEPVGPGSVSFLNGIAVLRTSLLPKDLLPIFKECEISRGRDPKSPRWSDRPLDMDIIGWGRRTFKSPTMQVPHASYHDRLFVLLPLRDIRPGWTDPGTGVLIDQLIFGAMPLQIQKTDIKLMIR
jgi:2-amino-4-hydroxy-6-hydroxymethyldihydropteridine diphosphokinase